MNLDFIQSIFTVIITAIIGPMLVHFLTKKKTDAKTKNNILLPSGYVAPKKGISSLFVKLKKIPNTIKELYHKLRNNKCVYRLFLLCVSILSGLIGNFLYDLLCPIIPCCITTPTITPTTIALNTTTQLPSQTNTITPTSTPSSTPLPPCNEQISISRPINNEQITAFRKQTGNLYWFETEGEITICPVETDENPQQWSIIFITEMDSPKCLLAKQIILDADNTNEWQASIPIANTTNLPEGDISPPVDVTLSAYLVPAESVNTLSDASYCRLSIDDYGLSNELLEQAISDQLTVQLIKTSK